MTVQELIDKLKKYSPEDDIYGINEVFKNTFGYIILTHAPYVHGIAKRNAEKEERRIQKEKDNIE